MRRLEETVLSTEAAIRRGHLDSTADTGRALTDREARKRQLVLVERFAKNDSDVTPPDREAIERDESGVTDTPDVSARIELERAQERERNRFARLFENFPLPAVHCVRKGAKTQFRRANSAFRETFGFDKAEIDGMDLTELLGLPEAFRGPDAVDRIRAAGTVQREIQRETADGMRDFRLQVVLEELAPDHVEVSVLYTDITAQKQRRRECQKLRQLQTTAWQTVQSILTPLDGDDVEATVCREITASDCYTQACFLQQPAIDDFDACECSPSGGGPTVDDQTVPAPESDEQLQVVGDTDPPQSPESTGEYTAACIPVSVDGIAHATLVVYTDRAGAFDEREREMLTELGRTIGYVVHCRQQTELLYGEQCVELTLACDDESATDLLSAAGETGTTLRLEAVVPVSEDRMLQYWQVTDGTAEEVAASLPDETDLRQAEGKSRLALTDTGPCLPATCVDIGGHPYDGRVTPDEVHLTVRFPSNIPPKHTLDRLEAVFPSVTVRSKQVASMDTNRESDLDDVFDGELTDRQRTALRIAYRSGYFGWPREATADEAASMMEIATPTFLRHLRLAQEQLVTTLLESADD